MRQRLQSLGRQLTIPVLHGISAFGTCLCFYTYHTRSQEVTPAGIPAHPTLVSDVAPVNRWNCDVLQADGVERLKKVVEEVKQMCTQI